MPTQRFAPRLKGRYIALAIGLALVPLALIAMIMQAGLRSRLEATAETTVSDVMEGVSSAFAVRVDQANAQLRTLAGLPPVLDMIRAQEAPGVDPREEGGEDAWAHRYRELLAVVAANHHDLVSVRLVSRNQRMLMREDFRLGSRLAPEARAPIEIAQDPAYANSYRLPVGRTYISPLQRRPIPGAVGRDEQVVSFGTPIYLEGHVRAVLIMDIRAEGMLPRARVRQGGSEILVADATGRYVDGVAPRDVAVGTPRNMLEDWPGLDPRKLDVDQLSLSHGRTLHARLMDANPNGIASFWMLGAAENEQVIDTLLSDMGRLILQWAIILGIIAISVALVMADLLSKPLRALSDTARRVMGGALDVRAPVIRNDEVGELASTFNNMLDSLQKSSQSLIDARILAEEATRAKSAFLANMSHEVRTPMSGVIGMLDLLAQSELDPRQRDYVVTAKNSVDALQNVLNDILDLSKIEAGKLTIDKIPFDLRRLAEECVRLFSHRAQEKRLRLVNFIPAEIPPMVVGDPTRVRQILMNLLGNATKFTNAGEVSLALRVRTEPGERCVIRFDIKDTGIGLSNEERRGLFQPFAQADNATTRNFGGTGLGLAICKRLVMLMHGEIGVDSRLGEGCLFWFEIPFRKAEVTMAPMPAPHTLAGSRILVVDDNATNRLVLVQYLEAWGLHPVAVDGPGAALGALREAAQAERAFDLAVLDMQMPAMDGIRLARVIGEEFGAKQPRFLLVSSLPRLDLEEAAAAGITHCLSRPVSQSQFLESVARAMGTEVPPVLATATPVGPAPLSARVLLVEDNLVNQQVALYTLRRMGLDVSVVASGRQAIEAVKKGSFDMVLMDCQMPEMDGFEATRCIRQMNVRCGDRPLPVIAMMANALEGDREGCLEAGMDDCLTKPFKQAQLRQAIERWLPRTSSSTQTSGA